MKKFMGTLACGFLLLMGSTHANAALLTEWNYTLSNGGIGDVSYGYAYDATIYGGYEGVTYLAGDYYHTVEGLDPTSGTSSIEKDGIFSIGGGDKNNDGVGDGRFIRYDTSMIEDSTLQENGGPIQTNGEKITDLSFTYTVTTGAVSMTVEFTFPLYTYYDAASDTAYAYYNENEISMKGKTSAVYDNYLYVVLGFNLTMDGEALLEHSANGAVYKGWAINQTTREGSLDFEESLIDSSVNMLSYSLAVPTALPAQYEAAFKAAMNPAPAPTPEPATMLLMGLGLLGLGAVAHRRKQ